MAPDAHLDESRWMALLDGRLDDDVRDAALDHIGACPQCAAVFRAARNAVAVVAPVPHRRRPPLNVAPAMAAAVTVCLAAWLWWPTTPVPLSDAIPPASSSANTSVPVPTPAPRPAKPAVEVSPDLLLTTRGDDSLQALATALAHALEPYRADDFAEAARRLRAVAADAPTRFEPRFYLGVSLALAGRSQEALPELERAATLAPATRRAQVGAFLDWARAHTTGPR